MITRPVFLLRLQPLNAVDPIRSLRAILKILKRKYGMRCLAAEQVPPLKHRRRRVSDESKNEEMAAPMLPGNVA